MELNKSKFTNIKENNREKEVTRKTEGWRNSVITELRKIRFVEHIVRYNDFVAKIV